MGGRPGVALPQSSTIASFDPPWRGAITGIDEMESAQDCRATSLERAMSALGQKRTFANSFDYPIGERQKVGWNFTPYRFGRLEVEHQFERCRLLNWQIGWLGPLEYLADEDRCGPKHFLVVRPIRHQPTCLNK